MTDFPRKKDYRQRAHANPFSDIGVFVPVSPLYMDWKARYTVSKPPDFVDIGCGYGKFLISVAGKFPGKNVCGMEIRKRVAEYVTRQIEAHRATSGSCLNVCAIHTNAMLFLPNFFAKSSLEKIFVLFPDPQFKKKKHKARIVSRQMSDVYSYLLKNNGRLYVSTDVYELFSSIVWCMEQCETFRRLGKEDCEADKLYHCIYMDTDESQRAAVKTGASYAAIFQKTTSELHSLQ